MVPQKVVKMDHRSESLQPQQIVPLAVLMVAALLVGLLLSIHGAQAGALQPGDQTSKPAAAESATNLGSAHLDLNALTRADNIDEADNVRWSLVRGTPEGSQVDPASTGVNWAALRQVTAEGSFSLPAGASWSFNAAFGGGPGYKQASGVLAGGQCALATVFKAAAMKAGLPNQSIPHRYPIPGFSHSETVTIWWGTYDLTIENPTGRALSLAWKLTPKGVDVNVMQ
jgi:hypothetical protein